MFLYLATLVSGMEIEILTDGDPTDIAPGDVADLVTLGEYTPAMDPWAR